MSSTTPADETRSENEFGSSTEQHVTGAAETETFPTDEEPRGATPSHGSSNAGINETAANRPAGDDRDLAEGRS